MIHRSVCFHDNRSVSKHDNRIFVCTTTEVFVYMTTEVILYLTTIVSVYMTKEVLFTWQQKCVFIATATVFVCLFVCLFTWIPAFGCVHRSSAVSSVWRWYSQRSDRCRSVAGDGRSRRAAANKQDTRSSYLIIKTEKNKLLGVITYDNLKWDAHM